jgi:hypothetical protein
MRHLVYSVRYSEVPINSSLLTITLHSSVTTTLVYSFRFVVLPSSTHSFTAGVEGCLFSLDHTQTHTTAGRTSLDEGSARHRDLYLTT